jgi:5-hydroxyisourate hydrolase-like protein (transthyretin family)
MYSHIHSGSARGFVGTPHRLLSRKNHYFLNEISMATVSSHILDSVSGKSAIAIRSQLFQLVSDTERQLIFDVAADQEGRVTETVVIDDANSGCEFELVFHGAEYFRSQGLDSGSAVRRWWSVLSWMTISSATICR